MFAEKVLHTEKNGFQWYFCADGPEAFSIDNKSLISGHVNDKIYYFCYDQKDAGRFIHSQYKRGGGYINRLYDSKGNFITNLDIQHGLDQVLGVVKRIKYQNSYYFSVEDYRGRSYYGVIDDNGNTTIPFSRVEIFDNVTNGKGGYVTLDGCLFIGNHSGGFGLIKPNGQVITPIALGNWMIGFGSEYVMFHTTHDVSLLDNTGNFIIKGAKRIEEVNGKFRIEDQEGNKGLYTFDGNCVVSPDLGYCEFNEFVGPNKARYFLVRETSSKLFGVVNEHWDELFPCEFESIEYIGGDFFKFKSGPNWGVVTKNGKVIIPTSRGYSSIGKYSSIQKRIPFTKPGYTGECNSLGTQVSLIKAPSTGIGNGTSSSTSTSRQNAAQTPNFYEETKSFFNASKSYSVESHVIQMLGPSGVTLCKEGESTFSVGNNSYSYKHKDGSGSTIKFTPSIKNVTVLTSRDDVTMPMYICSNGNGIRAIKYSDGHYSVLIYVENYSSGKYIHSETFNLRKK